MPTSFEQAAPSESRANDGDDDGSRKVARRIECPICGSTRIKTLYERQVCGKLWRLVQCGDCRLSFTSPRPTPEFLAQYYADDYHGNLRCPGAAEQHFGEKYARYVARLRTYLSSGRVIDVGCSTGLLVRLLADHGFAAEGIELNSLSAEWGRTHYGVPISNAAFDPSDLPPESVDAFMMTDFIEHTLNPLETLRQVWHVLRPSGYILTTFPNVWSLESQYLYYIAKASRRNWAWATCHIPGHIWEFTPATATAMFNRAGFEVVELRRTHPVEKPGALWLRVLHSPTRLLSFPPLAKRFGTQMEFIVRKSGNQPSVTS